MMNLSFNKDIYKDTSYVFYTHVRRHLNLALGYMTNNFSLALMLIYIIYKASTSLSAGIEYPSSQDANQAITES